MAVPKSRKKQSLQNAVGAWFDKAGRDLPWRKTSDPYAILVSELMCQQTQVATVIPYYERWLAKFPDFAALAAATEHDVLSLWQGLGYYSRARNLHRAAKHVMEVHLGKLPADAAAIRALPGVGRYTAGAVASFAFDLPEPLVDANVARVIARLIDLRTEIDSTRGQAALWGEAERLVPSKGAGRFNSAIMELGALVCVPRNPRCEECPISEHCLGYAAGTAPKLPLKKPRKKRVDLVEHCAWTTKGDSLLLEYQSGARWKGLWKLPLLPAEQSGEPIYSGEYPFTHHRVFLRVHEKPATDGISTHQKWVQKADLDGIPLTAPHRRAIEALASRF
jgi:A/G-specific adenine glycosylase